MKVLVAGATGVVGSALLPMLLKRGHHVAGLVRSDASAAAVKALGATALQADAFNAAQVRAALTAFRPEVAVHQMTALAGLSDLRKFDAAFALTNRLRTEGCRIMVDAAAAVGTRRFVSQGYCGWPYARVGGPVKAETDPLDPDPPAQFRRTFEALQQMERIVTTAPGLEGVVLRYGSFYGPGTNFARDGSFVADVRRRRVPLIGDAGGVFSFIHVGDVASATVAAIEGRPTNIFNVTDDEPAAVDVWLPYLASVVGARRPIRLPAWLMRLVLPEHLFVMMTSVRGGSNAKFKQHFGWSPARASWRDGFREFAA